MKKINLVIRLWILVTSIYHPVICNEAMPLMKTPLTHTINGDNLDLKNDDYGK